MEITRQITTQCMVLRDNTRTLAKPRPREFTSAVEVGPLERDGCLGSLQIGLFISQSEHVPVVPPQTDKGQVREPFSRWTRLLPELVQET
ncbi:AF-toxin biosynthesis protein 11-1 [Alternaria alternata]|nr:AF-toxin biosynthesis protein 11-1 [Alternaria alternata]